MNDFDKEFAYAAEQRKRAMEHTALYGALGGAINPSPMTPSVVHEIAGFEVRFCANGAVVQPYGVGGMRSFVVKNHDELVEIIKNMWKRE